MRIWSEVPKRRTQEVVADLATAVWVGLWAYLGLQLYGTLSQLSTVGVNLGETGAGLERAAATLRLGLSQVPLIGEGVGDLLGDALQGIGSPLVQAGTDLERLLLIVASVLGLLLVAVFVIPWLNRYGPWRRRRLRELNAGDRAIRQSVAVQESRIDRKDAERVLATRALYRLEYSDLLDHTPDPIGDFLEGRHDRLAKAEVESVGLSERKETGG
ncbi:MAG TPA: hypothetical protein VJ839_01265 [Candidatus Limnocylindria bacterium]|nr:hypothetical protein [Candidatus Limnocylindria bacterium]